MNNYFFVATMNPMIELDNNTAQEPTQSVNTIAVQYHTP